MRLTAYLSALVFSTLPVLGLAADRTVYGLTERVQLPELGVQLAAKLDTGAETASLSARDIQRFKRDGQSWVRFVVAGSPEGNPPIERPLLRTSQIKRRAGDCACDTDSSQTRTSRPVVELRLCLGRTLRMVPVNLTDRSAFQYPLLLGAQALKDFAAIVDPSLADTAGAPACAADALPAG